MGLQNLTIDQWIAAASSIGTLIAAILAYFSIREVRLQRDQQFQPRLLPVRSLFHAKLENRVLWEAPEADTAMGLSHDLQTDYSIPLINVGNGVATDVEISWKVDVDRWIQATNTMSAQSGAGIGVRKDSFGLSISQDGVTCAGMRLPEATGESIEYVLPVSAEKANTRIKVAPGVQALLHAYYCSYFTEKGDRKHHINPEPEFQFNIDIDYKDTAGRQFTRTSIISASVMMMTRDKSGAGVIAYALTPIRTEPPEGDSIAKKIILSSLKQAVSKTIPF